MNASIERGLQYNTHSWHGKVANGGSSDTDRLRTQHFLNTDLDLSLKGWGSS